MFHVGQKVVCVDASANKKYLPPGYCISDPDLDGLAKGRIYIIRGIIFIRRVPCVFLEEIIREVEPAFGFEAPYSAARFRPIVERKTDISIFTKMLKPEKV